MKCICTWFTALALIISAGNLHATTYTVDRTDDTADPGAQICSAAPNDCSLRGAVIKINGLSGTDEIHLPASAIPYTLTIPKGSEGDGALDLDPTVGDLDILQPITITGDGADKTSIVASGTNDRVFMGSFVVIDIEGVKISGGAAGSRGGGIWAARLTLRKCWITGNSAATDGGGVAVDTPGGLALILRGSTFSDNTASLRGGGLFLDVGGGSAEITNSTFSNNTVTGDGTVNTGGGAIDVNAGSIDVFLSTFAGNKVTTAGSAGGTILNVATGAGEAVRFQTSVLVGGTVAGTHQNCANSGNLPSSQGYNLSDDGTCTAFLGASSDKNNVSGTIVGAALSNNGGPTPTHLPPSNSLAIDFIPIACSSDEDQRGEVRTQDGNGDGSGYCDAGSVEVAGIVTGTTGGSTTGGGTAGTAGSVGTTSGGPFGGSSSGNGGSCSLIR